MTDNSGIKFTLGFEVQSDTVDESLNAFKTIEERMKRLNPVAAEVSQSFKEISAEVKELQRVSDLDQIAEGYAKLAASNKDFVGTQNEMLTTLKESGVGFQEQYKAALTYRKEIEQLVQEEKNLTEQEKGLTAGQRLTATRSLLSNTRFAISDISRGDIGGAAVNTGQAVQALGTLGVSLTAVLPLVLAFGAAAATVGILFAGATKVFRDGSAEIDQALKRMQIFYDAIGEGTTESINKQIDAINKQKDINQQFLEQIDRTRQSLKDGTGLDAIGEELVSIFGTAGLQAKADELSKKVQDAEFNVLGLNDALKSNAVAVNDSKVANEKAAEKQKEVDEAAKKAAEDKARQDKELLDRQTNDAAEAIRSRQEIDRQLNDLEKTGTTQQVDAQAQAVNELASAREAELNALYLLPNQTAETQARIRELERNLADLDYEAARLAGDVLDAASANDRWRKEIAETIKVSDEAAASATYQNELLKNGTSEKLADTVQEIDQRRKVLEAQKAQIESLGAVISRSDEAKQKLADINAELEKLGQQKTDIDAVKGIIEVREALKVIGDAAADTLEATQKFADKEVEVKQKQLEKEADLAQDYADKIVDIAQKAADDAEDALRKLENANSDAILDSQRDADADARKVQDQRGKDDLEFRRAEAKAYRDHANDLLKIVRDAQLREVELILNRDFAGLFLSRLKTVNDLQDKNADFTSKRIGEAEKFREKADDAARERAIDARERAISLQNKLADLRVEFERDAQAREINRQREEDKTKLDNERKLRDLDTQAQREANRRQFDFNAELQQIAYNAGLRINLIAEEQKRVNEGVGGIIALFGAAAEAARRTVESTLLGRPASSVTAGGGGFGFREQGGHLGAFEPVDVNELLKSGRREGFNGQPFPNARGVFIPFQAGYVNRSIGGGGRPPINMPITINESSSPAATAEVVGEMIDARMQYYLQDEG